MGTDKDAALGTRLGETVGEGIPAADLDDERLERELRQLHQTREEAFFDASADALRRHTERMLELEREYLERFPERTEPNPDRTRAGARERAGQDPDAPPSRRI